MQHQIIQRLPRGCEETHCWLVVQLWSPVLDLHHVRRGLLPAVQLAGHKLPAARIPSILSIHSVSPTLARSNACKQGRLGVGTNRLEVSCAGPGRLGLDR